MILDKLFFWNVKVIIFKKYGNSLTFTTDTGRFERKRIKTLDGMIENNYFHLKNHKVKIPAPEMKFYYDDSRTNTRIMYLFCLDRYTYYPISMESSQMKVNVPRFKKNQDGRIIINEIGQKEVEGYDEQILLDGNIVRDGENILAIPTMIANKTYDKENWLSTEIENASRMYRSKSFFERYGNIIIMCSAGILIVMMLYVGLNAYADMTNNLVEGLKSVSSSFNTLGDKVLQAVKTNATISGKPPY